MTPSAESQSPEPELDQSGIGTVIKIYRVPVGPRSDTQIFKDGMWLDKKMRRVWRHILAAERPDIVHIQHLMGISGYIVDDLLQNQIPYIVTLHDYWYGCVNAQLFTNYDHTNCQGPDRFINCGRCVLARGNVGTPWLAPVVAPILAQRQKKLRQVLREAKRVITPTQFVSQMYTKMGFETENFVKVPHGIEVPTGLIKRAKLAAAQRPRKGFHVVYVGGLSHQKGVHILVSAFNSLVQKDAHLRLYGDETAFPTYVASLKAMATNPKIEFGGRLPHDQVWQAIAAADVVALPTLWYEASPLVIDEIFAVQKPIIGSEIGALSEKIRDGIDGILVPVGDKEAWERALQKLVAEPERVHALSQNIQPVYPLEKHIDKIMSIYAEVID